MSDRWIGRGGGDFTSGKFMTCQTDKYFALAMLHFGSKRLSGSGQGVEPKSPAVSVVSWQ